MFSWPVKIINGLPKWGLLDYISRLVFVIFEKDSKNVYGKIVYRLDSISQGLNIKRI